MTNLEKQLLNVVEKRNNETKFKTQRYNESSKKQLFKIIETKLKTAFIAPLDYFETCFGTLWGHGKSFSELTNEEKKFRDAWNEIRNNVLNNGNGQIRAIQNELEQYTIIWERYRLNFKPIDDPRNRAKTIFVQEEKDKYNVKGN